MNKIFFGISLILISNSSFGGPEKNRKPAREPKATVCNADAVLSASLVYKISDPKGYLSDGQLKANPTVQLLQMNDDGEQWSVTWRGSRGSGIQYTVDVEPVVLNNILYSCDVKKIEKTAVN